MLIFHTVPGWHCPFRRRWFLSKESHVCWEGKEYDAEGQHLSLLLWELAIGQGQCVDVWVSRCVSKCGCACVCVCFLVCMCVRVYVGVCVSVWIDVSGCLCECMCMCVDMWVCEHMWMWVHMCVFMCMCMGVFVRGCVYVWERQGYCLSHLKQAHGPALAPSAVMNKAGQIRWSLFICWFFFFFDWDSFCPEPSRRLP